MTGKPHWPMFRRVWRQEAAFNRMMSKLSVDPVAAARLDQGLALTEARRKCLTCRSCSVCEHWLETGAEAPAHPPEFCLNSSVLMRLRPAPGHNRH